jgi:hypothetical protein
MKRAARPTLLGISPSGRRFLPLDRIHGADIVTCAAIDAHLLVDHIDRILGTDGIDWTNRFTCPATRTFVNDVMSPHTFLLDVVIRPEK